MIRAGDLNQKISIKRPVSVQNASGGFATGYATVLSTFARVKEVRSNPDLIAAQENVSNLLEVLIRYRPINPVHNGDVIHWRSFEYVVNNMVVDPLRTSIMFTVVANMQLSHRQLNETEYTPFPYSPDDTDDLTNLIIQIDGLAVNKASVNESPTVIEVGDRIWGWLNDSFISGIVLDLPYTDPGNIDFALDNEV